MLLQVDFYLLEQDTPLAAELLACRLLEKAYAQQLQTWVWCEDKNKATELDLLLWTFKEESFIPHTLIEESFNPRAPIEIATNYTDTCDAVLLINLSTNLVKPSSHLKRILEIVVNNEAAKENSRAHYRAYRELGYQLNIHKI